IAGGEGAAREREVGLALEDLEPRRGPVELRLAELVLEAQVSGLAELGFLEHAVGAEALDGRAQIDALGRLLGRLLTRLLGRFLGQDFLQVVGDRGPVHDEQAPATARKVAAALLVLERLLAESRVVEDLPGVDDEELVVERLAPEGLPAPGAALGDLRQT